MEFATYIKYNLDKLKGHKADCLKAVNKEKKLIKKPGHIKNNQQWKMLNYWKNIKEIGSWMFTYEGCIKTVKIFNICDDGN